MPLRIYSRYINIFRGYAAVLYQGMGCPAWDAPHGMPRMGCPAWQCRQYIEQQVATTLRESKCVTSNLLDCSIRNVSRHALKIL